METLTQPQTNSTIDNLANLNDNSVDNRIQIDHQPSENPNIQPELKEALEELHEPTPEQFNKWKEEFYQGLKLDDSEVIARLSHYNFIPLEKILTYCLVEDSPKSNVLRYYLSHQEHLQELNDSNKWKLFYLGVKYNQLEILQTMYISFGYKRDDLNINNNQAKNITEFSFLNIGIYQKNLPIIEFLLRMGSNPEMNYPINGNTSYHLAVIINQIEIVKILLQYSQNLNATNRQKNTSLHIASHNGNINLVKLLVDKGANINIKNYDSNTPIDLAELEEHADIVEYFHELKAESNYAGVFLI